MRSLTTYLTTKQGDMVAQMQGDTRLRQLLFNCCPDHAPPDFSLFDAIEVSPVAREADMVECPACAGPHAGCPVCASTGRIEETTCEVIFDGRTPDMWSVYGHFTYDNPRNAAANRRGVECLTDCPTEELATVIGLLFEALLPDA